VAVLLIGTLDTKGEELAFLRSRLRLAGCEVLLADVGTGGPPTVEPDIPREAIAGTDQERGAAMRAMADGAARLARRLHAEGRIEGVLGAGGSGNTAVATAAMRALPVGVPKLMVSTMAAGDCRDYVGGTDVTLMASVTDVAGLNSISAQILANAAGAMAGMVGAPALEPHSGRKLVGATMFGVTTPCVDHARRRLEAHGHEVLVFHATGTGGRAMEALVESGYLSGVLDVTTTELADDLVGGVLTAGPQRLEAAGREGVPQVVSLGALDMVNFGARASVPPQFGHRTLCEHNPSVTLMRTTAQECAELGRRIGRKLAGATGPTTLFVPLQGLSLLDAPGQPFHDPEADAALFQALRETAGDVEVIEMDCTVNDPAFAEAMADKLHAHL
jgi:uncharacterized protein (UPF0261 family)